MRVVPQEGVLNKLQQEKNMTDQEFSDFLGIARASLWRTRLPKDDKRFSLGNDVMAKILKKFPEKAFEELFFLDKPSQVCDKKKSKEVS